MADIGLLQTTQLSVVGNLLDFSPIVNSRVIEPALSLEVVSPKSFGDSSYEQQIAVRQNVDAAGLPVSKDFSSGTSVKQYWG